jgi:CubicO group peptidase (beta-lactamase class C family)
MSNPAGWRSTLRSVQVAAAPLLLLALGCATDPQDSVPPGVSTPETPTIPEAPPTPPITAFTWGSATPESQGMCGSTTQLGCTTTLDQIWNTISDARHNTKRFVLIRNDKIIYDRGGTEPYSAYSASKGLLGAPTLVHAMSQCGVGLKDHAGTWLGHGEGSRWATDYPWKDITIEHLATHTSGVCDYGDSTAVCGDESPGWQRDFETAKEGGSDFEYPDDAFTIARVQAEQHSEPALPPGTVYDYSNVGHALLNYAVQRACGQSLVDIYDSYIRQQGMGSAVRPALIHTDDGQEFHQSTGIAMWNGLDGASVLRLAGRRGIWENRNIEPVRYWHEVTKIEGNVGAAAAASRGVIYEVNANDTWTRTPGHMRFSPETFSHGGNYSTLFLNDPLSGTIIVRQGENNARGASYLTSNGCAPGWAGTAPKCEEGSDWSNNWNLPAGQLGSSRVGVNEMVVEPVQQAFFFPPPFCRMTSAGGQPVDPTTDVYSSPSDATTIDLVAEISVNPREGEGSSVVDRVEFYKEGDAEGVQHIGDGTLVEGSSPARYQLSYSADSHGTAGEVKTYFANCVARSTQDASKQVPSYSRPVRVTR